MAELLLVPEVAAGATEVVVSEWLVPAGGALQAGEPFAIIETEKAVVEVEAESDATLLRPLVAPGAQVEVGSPMALLGTSADLGSDLDALLAGLGAADAGTQAPALDGSLSDVQPPSQNGAPPTPEAPRTQQAEAAHLATRERIFISPLARRLLREAGIDPQTVPGTGPRGRIVRRDVQAAIDGSVVHTETALAAEVSEPAPPQHVATSGYSVVPHTRLRRAIATRLTQSKRDIPHFYVKRTAEVDELLALRERVNAQAKVKVSVNDFLVRAVAVAHQSVPEANVIWTDEGMHVFDTVDIAVAIASERGLVTPVLRSVESASLGAVSTAVKAYVEQANAGRLQQKDLEGGSISITNLGMFGVEEFSAIINPPQSAILAVGAGVPVARVVEGEVTAVTAMQLVLSVDHRAIDGALAARWMSALVEAIENPLSLLV
jgi:pyruvate dehydrogenase E2 component (dihydrolipoamide acetyltransferase)